MKLATLVLVTLITATALSAFAPTAAASGPPCKIDWSWNPLLTCTSPKVCIGGIVCVGEREIITVGDEEQKPE